MTTQASTKKNRSLRTTQMQYEELIKYMETHSEFAANKYLTKEGRIHNTQQWEELQKMLNALNSGPGKSVKQWQTVWRDLKSNASKKASKLRNERNRTGNFPVNAEPLDNLERRIIFCIGLEYVQGASDCPDSTPEEEYQIQLEGGNEDILAHPPTTTSITEVLDMENVTCANVTNSDHVFEASNEAMEGSQNNDELVYSDIVQCLRNEETRQRDIDIVRNTQKAPTKSQQRRAEILQNRKNRQRIGVQLQEAREKFSEIAENHTLHAEASMKQADATLLLAQNEKVRLQQEERRFAIEEKRITVDGATD